VTRFVGEDADLESKKLQERFNEQSKTAVWRRIAGGMLPRYVNGTAVGGLPGGEVWRGVDVPIFLIAGEADKITPPEEIEKIVAFFGKTRPRHHSTAGSTDVPATATPAKVLSLPVSETNNQASIEKHSTIESDKSSDFHTQPAKPRRAIKTTVIPRPAMHALLYTPGTARILAGLVSDFLSVHISDRLSLGWQLQYLSTEGKWDVKNLQKWKSVAPVSGPIGKVFRAMKTLREIDDTHCPQKFVEDWGSQIKDVIDISHESPVYDPRGLEWGGVRYHKFPTVSKIPPTAEEVNQFISLVDRIRESNAKSDDQTSECACAEKSESNTSQFIGVHCHYGFNRTGYFLVCYLVERCGYHVQDAIDEFAMQRKPGIKHPHFLDQLFVRYCVGLERAPTL
jgi:hypothetical protein